MLLFQFSLFSFLLFLISFIALAIASYTDLRKRIVSNKLNYCIIFLGIALHAIMSFNSNDFSFIANSAIAGVYAFALAFVFYKMGLWAGGDVKLFTGIAALNPVNVNLLAVLGVKIALFESIALPLFPITFFIFSIFCMFPYGAFLGIKKLKEKGFLVELKKKIVSIIFFSLFLTGAYALLNYFALNFLMIFIAIILLSALLGILNKKSKTSAWIVGILLFAFALSENYLNALQEFVYLSVFLFMAFMLLKLFFASRELFKKEIKISELEEGMILGESVFLDKGKVIKKQALGIGKVINYLRHNKLEELKKLMEKKGKEIVAAGKACGATVEEIKKLQELVKEKKLEDKIIVKESAPMVPAMLFAYVLLNVVGDVLWHLIL